MRSTHGSSAAAALTSTTQTASTTFLLLLFIAVGSFFPSMIFFVFDATSGALGLMIASLTLIAMVALGFGLSPSARNVSNALTVSSLSLALLVAHGAVAALLYPPDLSRFALSAAALAFTAFAGMLVIPTIFESNAQSIRTATNAMRWMFFVIGTLGILGIQPLANNFEKPLFPFTEPSHYVLAFAPFLIDGCVRSTGWRRLALLVGGYAIAYFMQSLSLVIATTLAAIICLSLAQLTGLAVLGIALIGGSSIVNIEYFAERINSSEGAQNISRLVYVQGWELVEGSLASSHGWGVGFQELGFAPINSPTADQLFRLLGTDANLKDGGFTAAKIISEFGVFGLVGVGVFVLLVVLAAWRLRAEALAIRRLDPPMILAYSFVAGYTVEMFVRGVGYFSGTTMFLIAAIVHVRGSMKSRALPHDR